MITFLDLLVIVAMVLAAISILSVVLMFLVKNTKAQRVFLWIAAVLGVYVGYAGVRMLWLSSDFGLLAAVILALASIGSVVLERLSKDSHKKLLIARILAAAALVLGMINAFC